MAAYYIMLNQPRSKLERMDAMKGAYLGPQYEQKEIEYFLKSIGANFVTLSHEEIIDKTAQMIADGKAVGWHQGRMEFGPRALGNRSIIADPRSPSMQKLLNLKVKYRESFRPFAPSILSQDVSEWFNLDVHSPYMMLVAEIKKDKQIEITVQQQLLFGIDKLNIVRSKIPAVTHVDYSARIQTVHNETNPLYYKLISRFKKLTGCPVLVNTSFNIRGEPIVCSPKDAFDCFMGTELDILVVGSCFLKKEDQPPGLKKSYISEFGLD